MEKYLLVDPTTQPMSASFKGAPRLLDLRGKRLGMIDDSKTNAKELLEALGALLVDRYEVRLEMYHRKPSASKPADPKAVADMGQRCDFAIVAIGDWGSCSACSVHDGIHVEKVGIPAAVICTDRFRSTGQAMAKMWGAPEFPTIYTAHPVGTLDTESLQKRAKELVAPVVAVLTGVDVKALKVS